MDVIGGTVPVTTRYPAVKQLTTNLIAVNIVAIGMTVPVIPKHHRRRQRNMKRPALFRRSYPKPSRLMC